MHTRYASIVHLSIALGGVLDLFLPIWWSLWFPLVLWLCHSYNNEKTSQLVNWSGREAVRLNLFIALYQVIILVFCITAILLTPEIALGSESLPSAKNLYRILMEVPTLPALFIGAVVFALLDVAAILLPIYAAIKTLDGDWYVYPGTFSPRRQHAQLV